MDINGLRELLDSNKVLKHFVKVPSKDNGIDTEAIVSEEWTTAS